MASTFSRWTMEGQLATLVMGIVFVTWLAFQIWVPALERPTILNEVLLAVLGAWITNLSYGVTKRNERIGEEKEQAEEARVDQKVQEALAERQGGRHRA